MRMGENVKKGGGVFHRIGVKKNLMLLYLHFGHLWEIEEYFEDYFVKYPTSFSGGWSFYVFYWFVRYRTWTVKRVRLSTVHFAPQNIWKRIKWEAKVTNLSEIFGRI